ncbi:MAG: hypothetical protein CSA96_08735 [Bacteroidetes bacterium]|nr:MAG: hypothetical protein CSA96_08735 [Bacteroidota bacterium]
MKPCFVNPCPFPLENFPGIPGEYCGILASKGIKTTEDFFESQKNATDRNKTAEDTGIPPERLNELFALCDLSRIEGIGPVLARLAYICGTKSVGAFSKTRAEEEYRKYIELIDRYGYKAEDFSVEDLAQCIQRAELLMEMEQKNTDT